MHVLPTKSGGFSAIIMLYGRLSSRANISVAFRANTLVAFRADTLVAFSAVLAASKQKHCQGFLKPESEGSKAHAIDSLPTSCMRALIYIDPQIFAPAGQKALRL